jgi:hypothetical protein
MATQFPQRPRTHQLEAESFAYLRTQVPPGWTCDRPEHDYGIDLRLGLARDGQVTGEQLVLQVKSSDKAPQGEAVSVSLEVPTVNLLRNMLDVVMIVKYVAQEREAYWLLLKDFTQEPRGGQKVMTLRIPRVNTLSARPWDHIANHVRAVHFRKLNANVQGVPHGGAKGRLTAQ